MADHCITLHDLRVVAWMGVPAEERAAPQTLALTVRMTPRTAFAELGDAIERTVDYKEVADFAANAPPAGRGRSSRRWPRNWPMPFSSAGRWSTWLWK